MTFCPRSTLVCRVLVALGLLLPLVPAITPDVHAASTASSSGHLNLRALPTPTSTIRSIVPPQVALFISGNAQNGYLPVTYGEEAGWIATDLVQVELRVAPAVTANFDENQLLPEGFATLTESLNLRTGPGIEYDALQIVDVGTRVEATGEIIGLYEEVEFGDKEGWVRSIYVDRGPDPEGDERRHADVLSSLLAVGQPLVRSGQTMIATTEIVLRQQPSASSGKLGVVPLRSKVILTGKENDGYVEVQFEGKTGWVAEKYLRLSDLPDTETPDVPVLMYHSIQANGANYQVTAAQLDQQLQWLSANGYTSITSTELLAWLTYGVPLPEKPIIISIDDGNASDWQFLELLERYGFQGVFSLPNYAELSPRAIRTLDRAGEVCGHTVSHQNLSTLSWDEQVYQIVENKKYLEKILGNKVNCFAYPFGAFNGLTVSVIIEAGYLMAFNVDGGPQPLDESIDRWHIRRINVNGTGTFDDFVASLQP